MYADILKDKPIDRKSLVNIRKQEIECLKATNPKDADDIALSVWFVDDGMKGLELRCE